MSPWPYLVFLLLFILLTSSNANNEQRLHLKTLQRTHQSNSPSCYSQKSKSENGATVLEMQHKDYCSGSVTNMNRNHQKQLIIDDDIRVRSIQDSIKNIISGKIETSSQNNIPISSGVKLHSLNYIVTVTLGGRNTTVIVDTGSDLTWIQCQPCRLCYNQPEPLFNPSVSPTYRKVICNSSVCQTLQSATGNSGSCGNDLQDCSYVVNYGDGSYTRGAKKKTQFLAQKATKKRKISTAMCRRLNPRVPHLLLSFFCSSILLSSLPELITAAVVTLDSIEIYNTHEFFGSSPEVYFKCKGENRTIYLPDVKKKHELYIFKGEESWQPLTELEEKKCKRCGIYEKDSFVKPDDIFDEWEFCASDFTSADGKYIHFKEKEFNATFLCPDCLPLEGVASNHTDVPRNKEKGMHWALVLLICVLVTTFIVFGAVSAYKYWQKRKKQQEQARFLKLFEESDDIEDELGIGPLSHVI